MEKMGSADATVDIYWTGNAGWGASSLLLFHSRILANLCFAGLRLGEGSRVIERGTLIGVYAGELITAVEAEERNEVYNILGRTYLFRLDHWSLAEAFGKDYQSEYEVDALSYGKLVIRFFDLFERREDGLMVHCDSFARFLNHRCVPNVIVRSVYIDEANLKRPLFVRLPPPPSPLPDSRVSS